MPIAFKPAPKIGVIEPRNFPQNSPIKKDPQLLPVQRITYNSSSTSSSFYRLNTIHSSSFSLSLSLSLSIQHSPSLLTTSLLACRHLLSSILRFYSSALCHNSILQGLSSYGRISCCTGTLWWLLVYSIGSQQHTYISHGPVGKRGADTNIFPAQFRPGRR